ncbi:MAG TPA: hypothetical protein EYQ54_13040 [Myxococcales bacterium]|nr:hypothetical protein [Myxococcales bacterium]
MNQYKALAARFENLHSVLDTLHGLALDQGQEETAKRIEALSEKSKDRVFRVAIAGEFSTGKSTLINSLLGEDLLPTGLEACTAVVTRIRCSAPGEEPAVRVRFRKSGWKKVERDRLRELLTFEGRKSDDAPIEAEVVLSGGTFLDHGIELVDTPGVNDPDARGEQITLGFLPQADAIIFITHTARAFKESELEFLRDRIGDQDRERVLFVVNASDIMEEERDFDDIRSRAANDIGDTFDKLRVHLVSARDGLRARQEQDPGGWDASGMRSFADDLDRMLTQERGEAEVERFRSHAVRFREDLSRRLEEKIQTLGMDDKIRLRRCERVREKLAILERAEKETSRQAEAGFQQVRKSAFDALESELSSLRAKLAGMESSGEEGKQKDLTDRVGGVVSAAGSRTLTKIQSSMRSSVGRLHDQLASQMNSSLCDAENVFSEDDQAPIEVQGTSWDGLITVNTDRYVEEREEEEEAEDDGWRINEEQASTIGAGLFGLIGLAMLGPFGLLAGGVLGWGTGDWVADNQQPGGKIFKTVQSWFVKQEVDADRTVADVGERIKDGMEPALDHLKECTQRDVRAVFASKIGECRERLADLEEPTREAEEQDVLRQRAEEMLEKLRQVPVRAEGE